jgi:hypothetical protein
MRVILILFSIIPHKCYSHKEQPAEGKADGIPYSGSGKQHLRETHCPEYEEIIKYDIEKINNNSREHKYLGMSDAVEEASIGNDEKEERQADELVLHVVGSGAGDGAIFGEEINNFVGKSIPEVAEKDAKDQAYQ